MKTIALLLLAVAMFAQGTGTGFIVSISPVAELDPATGNVRDGVLVSYASDSRDTVGFIAEIKYTLPNDPRLYQADSFAMPDYSMRGRHLLWIGKPSTIAVTAIEVRGFGRQASTASNL